MRRFQVIRKISSKQTAVLFSSGNFEDIKQQVARRRRVISAVFFSIDMLNSVQLAALQTAFSVPVYDRLALYSVPVYDRFYVFSVPMYGMLVVFGVPKTLLPGSVLCCCYSSCTLKHEKPSFKLRWPNCPIISQCSTSV